MTDKKITKTDLIDSLASETGSAKAEITRILDALSKTLINSLVSGHQVSLPGVFTAKVTERQARQGRNPRTGEEITIPKRNAASFTASKTLKDALN